MRTLVLLLALYVTFDFGSPFLPGAFAFDPDESVDAISQLSFSAEAEVPPLVQNTAAWREDDLPEGAPALRRLVMPRVMPVMIRRVSSTASHRDAPSPADEHQL